ncbi:MAG: 50S ribosomal protein L35 [Proteobacteria bacterium]|nr:50S ribosomal protein L35 [Pseudomonadota bacterium]
MPKVKTKSGASKRFKVTGTGKVKYKKSGLMHKLSCKSEGRKRNLKQRGVLGPSDTPRVVKQLPYEF